MTDKINNSRRGLIAATCTVGGVAGLAATGVFVSSLAPSSSQKKEQVTVNIEGMRAGDARTTTWQGKPVWVLKRSEDMLATLHQTEEQVSDPHSERTHYAATPEAAKNQWRAIRPDIFVFSPVCPHLGCTVFSKLDKTPTRPLPEDWQGGFFCPCHGSTFDIAGRVFKDKPAVDNLEVPPHHYVDANTIMIGEDDQKTGAA